jgi:CRP-like cAMP-binding protein
MTRAQNLAISRALLRRLESYPNFPLNALETVVELRTCLDQIERRAVESARERGATWEDIATAVGVSRQAIYQKYRNHREDAAVSRNGRRPKR